MSVITWALLIVLVPLVSYTICYTIYNFKDVKWYFDILVEDFKFVIKRKKVEKIKSMVIPLGSKFLLNEKIFRETTEALNTMITRRPFCKADNIRSIDTSVGPDNVCYITVCYSVKEYTYKGNKKDFADAWGGRYDSKKKHAPDHMLVSLLLAGGRCRQRPGQVVPS